MLLVFPGLPGFEGEPNDVNAAVFRMQIQLMYDTIRDMLNKLTEVIGEDRIDDYLLIVSLRQHGMVDGVPKSEIIYVHSKLIIVDDWTVVCGSANLNDRSLKGTRDTEMAVVIEEEGDGVAIDVGEGRKGEREKWDKVQNKVKRV